MIYWLKTCVFSVFLSIFARFFRDFWAQSSGFLGKKFWQHCVDMLILIQLAKDKLFKMRIGEMIQILPSKSKLYDGILWYINGCNAHWIGF